MPYLETDVGELEETYGCHSSTSPLTDPRLTYHEVFVNTFRNLLNATAFTGFFQPVDVIAVIIPQRGCIQEILGFLSHGPSSIHLPAVANGRMLGCTIVSPTCLSELLSRSSLGLAISQSVSRCIYWPVEC